MWYPNRAQWSVVWIVVPLALLLWVASAESADLPGRLAVSLVVLGGFLFWAFAKPRERSERPEVPPALPQSESAQPQDRHIVRCQSCGRQIKSGSVFCPLCGGAQLSEERIRQLTRGHGWIGLVCASLLVFGPLGALIFTLTLIGNGASSADWLRALPPVLTIGLLAVYGFTVGVRLWHRTPSAVWHAKFYFTVSAIASVGLIIWAIFTLSPARAGQFTGQMAWGLLGCAIWLSYFRRSVRVALTYGKQSLGDNPGRKETFVAALAVALLVGVPAGTLRLFWPSISQTWISYGPTGGGFEVEFPGQPTLQKITQPVGTQSILLTRTMVETPSTGGAFVVTFFDLPSSTTADTNALLNSMTQATEKDPKMTNVVQRSIFLGNAPGREYTGDAGPLRIRGRLFLDNRRVYELRAVTATDASGEQVQAADRFLNSFSLKPR